MTELAILTIPLATTTTASSPDAASNPSTSATARISPLILDVLARAKTAMQDISGDKFAFYLLRTQQRYHQEGAEKNPSSSSTIANQPSQPAADTASLLIIGGWPSVAFHMNTWLPSPENQALVKELDPLGTWTQWMWHIGVPRVDVEDVLSRGSANGKGLGGGVRLWRGVFDSAEKKTAAESTVGKIQAEVGKASMAWAWRLDKGYWAAGQTDVRAEAGVDAAELVLIARSDADGKVDGGLEDGLRHLATLAVHVVDERGMVLEL